MNLVRRLDPILTAAGVVIVGLAIIVGVVELLVSGIRDPDMRLVLAFVVGLIGGVPVGQIAFLVFLWRRDQQGGD